MTPRLILALALTLTLAACGSETPTDTGTPAADATTSSGKILLDKDLEDAVSVLDAKGMKEGDEVAVYGRIADMPTEYVAFRVTDDELDYCGRGTECEGTCKTPWDYCCIQKETVVAASMPVELHDKDGNPVKRAGADLRLLDLVAMKGTLTKTESGGMMLVVKGGLYKRERATVKDHVVFPD
jgi:hypothetical protein